MDTPTSQHLTLVADEQPPPTHQQRLAGWLRNLRRPAWLRVPHWARQRDTWIVAGGVTVVIGGGLALIAGILWLIAAIVSGIGDILSSAAAAGGDGARDAAHWISHNPLTRTVTEPLRVWFDAHSNGLPVTGHDLWILWLVIVGAFYLAALAGSKYARIGWAVLGAATAAAAWHGTTVTANRPAAAAVTAGLWLLLSLPAYARLTYVPTAIRTAAAMRPTIVIPERPTRPTARTADPIAEGA